MKYHIEPYHQIPSYISAFPDYRKHHIVQDVRTLNLIVFTIIKYLLAEGVLDDELKGKMLKYTLDHFDNPFVCK